jgi:hypothetical protein
MNVSLIRAPPTFPSSVVTWNPPGRRQGNKNGRSRHIIIITVITVITVIIVITINMAAYPASYPSALLRTFSTSSQQHPWPTSSEHQER